MNTPLNINVKGTLALVTALLIAAPVYAQHGWPVEPANSDHPMGNSFGEFYSSLQHVGIDLMETPMYDASWTVDASAPWVIATVAGTPTILDNGGTISEMYNHSHIDPTNPADTAEYKFWHLQKDSFAVDYVNAFNNGTAVAAGDEIAKIARWSACNFHHLHYELDDGTNYLNPLADITPNPDTDPPHIEDIHFAVNNSDPWVAFNAGTGDSCAVVSGAVDILAEGGDRDEAGMALGGLGHLWLYNVRWRACPDTTPNCPWVNTRAFDTIPYSWYTSGNVASKTQFSTRAPWISNTSYCNAGWDYNIVTNYVAGSVNASGYWDTTAIADGSYSVSIEMEDFAGNKTIKNRRACVQNSSGCTTELTMRDATDDYGAIPYTGSPWWVSPDITANPGTPDQDHNINVGAANPVELRVWNRGSCSVPAGTTYDVCLGWGPPSGSVAYPLPASQIVGCQTETVPPGGWPVGSSRTTTITWTPDPLLVPLGHHCLIGWIDMTPDDQVLNTPSVRHDDNRAQQNITFTSVPGPGRPAFGSFWINPQKMINRRSLELRFSSSSNIPVIEEVRLHISPGLSVDRIVGGSVIGGYTGDKPQDVCELDPKELYRLLCEPGRQDRGYTKVIGGLDPAGRLLLEGLQVREKPVRVMVEVVTGKKVKHGNRFTVDVVEFGILENQETQTEVGGVTLVFEL